MKTTNLHILISVFLIIEKESCARLRATGTFQVWCWFRWNWLDCLGHGRMPAPLWRKVERADDQPFISRAVCRVSRLYVKEPVYWFESGRDLLQDNCSKVSALCNALLTLVLQSRFLWERRHQIYSAWSNAFNWWSGNGDPHCWISLDFSSTLGKGGYLVLCMQISVNA